MKKGIDGFEKIIIAVTALFIAKKAIENPKQAKGCLSIIILYFIISFFILLTIGVIKDIVDYAPPLEQAPGESIEHRNYRQRLKDEGYGPEMYEYKNSPEVHY